ncbi:PREDICTED: uncharacterized protein LOC105454305 [Wasmannia auropunctata]|uniref:uncharacterized protein LOC105454305 n=1 Tax=Wasmannia auropunctata TaxID=64793 RepID=UPI0005EF2F45|nr:PREDICTED: uncharacterized protein LOC105454305 [Wasmannia auropunctata]
MLRRQCDPTNVVRRLFNSKSRRSLSVASILHTHEKTVGGFLTWLKDIFNKSAEDKSRKADTANVVRAATATTFNRSEIAAPMRPADTSDKVDVVNQKLANFCAAQSTTRSEYGNIRAEKRDAANGGRACTIQQSAIYAASQSIRFAAGKACERGIEPDSSWREDSGKMYRSERNGGAIEFAARDDLDAASHYRCYTSPRHCYRLPSQQRTNQQPTLLGLCALNRYIGVSTRALVGFGPKNSKPPIREPNAPEKREKKDERKDKKEKKKPVIRTDGESVSVDSSENRAEMVADDNPRSDPDVVFRYEWGVKLAEEQPAAEAGNDNDKFAEKGQQYVTKRLWGVNLKQPKSDIAPPATASSGRGSAGQPRNASSIVESGDTTAVRSDAVPAPSDSPKKSDASSLRDTTAEYLSTPSRQTGLSEDFIAARPDSGDASSYMTSTELRETMRTSPNTVTETIIVDNEYNIPEEAASDAEITAWQNLAMKSIPDVRENYLSADNVENLEMVSIRPEAPQPKLDVQIVRSNEDDLKDKEPSDFEQVPPISVGIKPVGSPRKSKDYSISKKMHTMSTQIRHVHQHTNSTSLRLVESLSSHLAPVNKIMPTKYPGFASAFSTNPEDSVPEKTLDETSRNKQQIDSKSQNEGKSNEPDSNDTSNSNRSLLSAESQTVPSGDQERADADLAKTLDIIADKEMEISINQLQSTGRKENLSDSIASSEFPQKDKSHHKDDDVQNEKTERYEEPYVNYADSHDEGATHVDFNNHSINSDSTVKSTKGDSSDNSTTFHPNVDDDPSKEYIIDGDYVRLPGDPYPYSRENLDKWRVPRSRNLVYKSWKRETFRSSDSPTVNVRSTLRNANDAYANAAGEPRVSHAGDAVMETSGSGGGDGGASARKQTGLANGFHVSPRDQRVVSDCLRGDAADALGLRQWTKAFSRLDVGEKINEAARSGDNAPSRARYEYATEHVVQSDTCTYVYIGVHPVWTLGASSSAERTNYRPAGICVPTGHERGPGGCYLTTGEISESSRPPGLIIQICRPNRRYAVRTASGIPQPMGVNGPDSPSLSIASKGIGSNPAAASHYRDTGATGYHIALLPSPIMPAGNGRPRGPDYLRAGGRHADVV